MKYITKKHMALPIALLTTLSSFAWSDDNALDTIVVTATRTPQKVSDSLSTTTVITREEIDRLQPQSFTDLLSHEVGIDFSQNGGKGTSSSIFLRGTNSDHIVVLMDGVRINTTDNGRPSLEFIDLENIDHIEIVRGSNSSLYGNDAVGGVIQIFTRKGGDTPTTTVKAGYGSNAETLTSVNSSGNFQDTHYNALISYNQTNGINATSPNNSSYDPDHDGYRNTNAALSMDHKFDGGHNVGFTFNRNEGQAEFDMGETNFTTQAASVYAKVQATDTLKSSLTLSNFINKQTTPVYPSTYDTDHNNVLWQNDWQASSSNLITGGLEYTRDILNTDQGFAVSSRYNHAVFLQDQIKFDAHSFQLGARNDNNSQYSSVNTWNAGYGYALSNTLNFFTNYGTAFHAPTFVDLYYPYGYGNPNLKPEKSRTGEVGLKSDNKSWYWTASAYQTKIKDLIELDSFYAPYNTDKATISGLDLTAGTAIDEWKLSGTASFLNPKDDTTGKRLARRSKQIFGLNVDRNIGHDYTAGASWHFQDGRPDNTHYLGGYNTLDLHGNYQTTKDLKLTLSFNNLFNNEYHSAYGYEAPGREAMLMAELAL